MRGTDTGLPTAVDVKAFYPLIIVPGMVQVLAPATIHSMMVDLEDQVAEVKQLF